MSTLMITAPLLVGNLIGSSLGVNAYSPFGNGDARSKDGTPLTNKVKKQTSNTAEDD